MTVALDAKVLIAHLDARDPLHGRAAELLVSAAGQRLIAHPLTIAEVIVGSARLYSTDERLEIIRKMGVETIEMDAGAPARLAELRASISHRLPDCCVLDTATQYRAALATLDERLAKVARALGLPCWNG